MSFKYCDSASFGSLSHIPTTLRVKAFSDTAGQSERNGGEKVELLGIKEKGLTRHQYERILCYQDREDQCGMSSGFGSFFSLESLDVFCTHSDTLHSLIEIILLVKGLALHFSVSCVFTSLS